MDRKEYSVSEAVRLIGVESHVLRYWEEELPVEVRRNAQGHRIYSEENIAMFRYVRELKEKGLQLKAIRMLMDRQGRLDPGVRAEDVDFSEQIRELTEPDEFGDGHEKAQSDAEELCCEVVPLDEQGTVRQFELILRRMMEEVVSEQNEKLEEAIAEHMKSELEDFYLQCCQIMQEAAVSREAGSSRFKRLRRALRKMFSRKT